DTNAQIIKPILDQISRAWAKLFEFNLFEDFGKKAFDEVQTFLSEVEKSVPRGLRDRAKLQREVFLKETRLLLDAAVTLAGSSMTRRQRNISR
ncbi:hypothetical protein SISNIDRAFT_400462, partial [Sistotremastrum niveocremeum HHB9708]